MVSIFGNISQIMPKSMKDAANEMRQSPKRESTEKDAL